MFMIACKSKRLFLTAKFANLPSGQAGKAQRVQRKLSNL